MPSDSNAPSEPGSTDSSALHNITAATSMSRQRALVWVCVAYVTCLYVGGVTLYLVDINPVIDILIADIAATLVIFCFSRYLKNSSMYDAFWTVIPPFIVLYWMMAGRTGYAWGTESVFELREVIVLGLVLYWATRLTLNWAVHWEGIHHEDWRYPIVRQKAPAFAFFIDLFGIHLMPTLQVFAGLLPVYAVACLAVNGFGWLDIIATIITFGAITIQMVADFQLHNFIANKQPGETIRTGLWGWSRHPNYFGELGFWFGLMLFGLSAYPQGWMWICVGFVAMALLFYFFSIPQMDQRSLQRRPEYRQVMDSVSMVVPWPPKKSAS